MRKLPWIINKAVYLAIGVNMNGIKEVLDMWTAESEGARFRLQVATELKRGCHINRVSGVVLRTIRYFRVYD